MLGYDGEAEGDGGDGAEPGEGRGEEGGRAGVAGVAAVQEEGEEVAADEPERVGVEEDDCPFHGIAFGIVDESTGKIDQRGGNYGKEKYVGCPIVPAWDLIFSAQDVSENTAHDQRTEKKRRGKYELQYI